MSEQPFQTESDLSSEAYELVILQILYRKKWILLLGALLAGVLAAAYSLTKPNVYEARAALTVQREKTPLDEDQSGFNIEILQSLTESTDIKYQLYQSLLKDGVLKKEETTFQSFVPSLTTGVQEESGLKRNLLPVLILKAKSQDQELAQKIANAWAEAVLEQTRRIYTSDIRDQSDFIQPVFEEVDKNLMQNEDRYTSTQLEANIALNQATLKKLQASYSEIYGKWLDLKSNLLTDRALYEELSKQLALQEVNGVWLGDALWEAYRNNYPVDFDINSPKAKKLARVIREIMRNEEAMAIMERESELEFMEMDLKNKERQLQEISLGILEAQNKMAKMEKEYEVHEKTLSGMSAKTTYTKTLTRDVIFQAVLDNQLEGKNLPALVEESPNPVHNELEMMTVRMAGEIIGAKSQVDYFEKKREFLKQEVAEMSSEITKLKAKRDTLASALASQKKALEEMRIEYDGIRQQLEKLGTTLIQTEVKKQVCEEEWKRLKEEIQELEKSIFLWEDQIAQRKREVEDVKTVRASLATRKQEIALLQISASQSARSGVKLLYAAQTNPQKVGPARTKLVLIAMVLSFIALSTWLLLDFFLKGSERNRKVPTS